MMDDLWLVSYIFSWALLLLVTVLLIGAYRHIGFLYRRRSDLQTSIYGGQTLPDISLKSLEGNSFKLSQVKGTETTFFIVSPSCSGCDAVLKSIEVQSKSYNSSKRSIILSLGDPSSTIDLLRRNRVPPGITVLLDIDRQISEKWGIRATPSAVIVNEKFEVVAQGIGTGPPLSHSGDGSFPTPGAVSSGQRMVSPQRNVVTRKGGIR